MTGGLPGGHLDWRLLHQGGGPEGFILRKKSEFLTLADAGPQSCLEPRPTALASSYAARGPIPPPVAVTWAFLPFLLGASHL